MFNYLNHVLLPPHPLRRSATMHPKSEPDTAHSQYTSFTGPSERRRSFESAVKGLITGSSVDQTASRGTSATGRRRAFQRIPGGRCTCHSASFRSRRSPWPRLESRSIRSRTKRLGTLPRCPRPGNPTAPGGGGGVIPGRGVIPRWSSRPPWPREQDRTARLPRRVLLASGCHTLKTIS